MDQEQFAGEVRSLVHGVASDEAFARLCELFDARDELDTALLRSAAAGLAQWPATLERPVPKRWWRPIIYGQASARVTLCDTLDLSGQRIGPGGARALAQAEHMHTIRRAVLDRNELGDDGLGALCGARSMTASLRQLHLMDNHIGPLGARTLAQARELSALEVLALTDNPLGDEGAVVLSRATSLLGLRELNVVHTQMGAEGLTAILSSSAMPSLEALYVGGNQLGREAVEVLERCGNYPSLRALYLNNNTFTDIEAQALASISWLSQLDVLDLSRNAIAAEGIRVLSHSPFIRDIEHTNLSGQLALAQMSR